MKLTLIQPYDMKLPGAVIELPDGLASTLILRRIALQADETQKDDAKPPKRKQR